MNSFLMGIISSWCASAVAVPVGWLIWRPGWLRRRAGATSRAARPDAAALGDRVASVFTTARGRGRRDLEPGPGARPDPGSDLTPDLGCELNPDPSPDLGCDLSADLRHDLGLAPTVQSAVSTEPGFDPGVGALAGASVGAHLDAVRSYPEQRLASDALAVDLARARWVKVITSRGNELTREGFRPLWKDGARAESVRILLPDPGASWLRVREAELRRHDPGFRPGLLGTQVAANIDYLTGVAADTRRVELRLYDLPQTCRAVVTDEVAYLTTYTADAHGRQSPCLVFPHGHPMYDFALRLFTVAWDNAEATGAATAPPPSR